MRQSIELNLHVRPDYPVDPLMEQRQRRIFWETYMFDRYSSGTLDRPFVIADQDITVELPINADDDTILGSDSSLPLSAIPTASSSAEGTEVSVFILYIKDFEATQFSLNQWSKHLGR